MDQSQDSNMEVEVDNLSDMMRSINTMFDQTIKQSNGAKMDEFPTPKSENAGQSTNYLTSDLELDEEDLMTPKNESRNQ